MGWRWFSCQCQNGFWKNLYMHNSITVWTYDFRHKSVKSINLIFSTNWWLIFMNYTIFIDQNHYITDLILICLWFPSRCTKPHYTIHKCFRKTGWEIRFISNPFTVFFYSSAMNHFIDPYILFSFWFVVCWRGIPYWLGLILSYKFFISDRSDSVSMMWFSSREY